MEWQLHAEGNAYAGNHEIPLTALCRFRLCFAISGTTNHGSTARRFVTEQGLTAVELTAFARTDTNFNGMERWRYIAMDAPQTAGGAKRVRSDSVIRPTAYGLQARKVWRPLFSVVEDRWRE